MNEQLDVFSMGMPQKGNFFYFKEVGDQIKGTYVDMYEGVDSFNNEQYIYIIKDDKGEFWRIGFRKSNSVMHDEMSKKSFGDIIGLRYEEDRPSKKYKGKTAKIIRVYPYHKKGPVDEAWLAERGMPTSAPAADVEEEIRPVSTGVVQEQQEDIFAEEDSFDAVRNLAKTKGLVTDQMTKEEANAAIIAYTKLPMVEENMASIIISLTSYKA
jgi:hypothetical protein